MSHHSEPETMCCTGHTTPQQQQQQQQHIDNSIFNTISKIVNRTAKVPEIEDFKIVKPISRGAFGKVFLGFKKTNPNQVYAIKVMKKDEMIHKNMASQVIIERNALAIVKSPYCVQLFYSLQSVSSVYLVMEYMVGGDLKSLLGVYGFMEEPMAAFYAAEVSLALEYLHSHGIVHRDLKPDNMLLSKEGHVKLTDFGLSKITTTMHRDLEISDLVNPCCTPSLCTRTPGQLLSLTSHLTFDSLGDKTEDAAATTTSSDSTFFNSSDKSNPATDLLPELQSRAHRSFPGLSSPPPPLPLLVNNGSSPPDALAADATASACDYSRVSGVSPLSGAGCDWQSAEDIQFASAACQQSSSCSIASSYHTCESVTASSSSCISAASLVEANNNNNNNNSGSDSTYKNSAEEEGESTLEAKHSQHHHTSPTSSAGTSLITPTRGTKRKRKNKKGQQQQQQQTGLTREICFMGLRDDNLTTPKKKNRLLLAHPQQHPQQHTPPFVVRTNNLKMMEASVAAGAKGGSGGGSVRVAFSTPVSSTKQRSRSSSSSAEQQQEEKPMKSTRFDLPPPPAVSAASVSFKQNDKLALEYRSPPPPSHDISPIKTPATGNQYTPYRTPKSVRRGRATGGMLNRGSDDRILGTPDYLAPELLLRQGHGPAVDWWALGVCLYEFCTGIPPFTDETPQAVFANILARDLAWPEGEECLTVNAMEAIDSLLTLDQKLRPKSVKEVRVMKFFRDSFPWDDPQSAVPPFVPQPDDNYDTCYFQARNILQHLNVSSCDT